MQALQRVIRNSGSFCDPWKQTLDEDDDGDISVYSFTSVGTLNRVFGEVQRGLFVATREQTSEPYEFLESPSKKKSSTADEAVDKRIIFRGVENVNLNRDRPTQSIHKDLGIQLTESTFTETDETVPEAEGCTPKGAPSSPSLFQEDTKPLEQQITSSYFRMLCWICVWTVALCSAGLVNSRDLRFHSQEWLLQTSGRVHHQLKECREYWHGRNNACSVGVSLAEMLQQRDACIQLARGETESQDSDCFLKGPLQKLKDHHDDIQKHLSDAQLQEWLEDRKDWAASYFATLQSNYSAASRACQGYVVSAAIRLENIRNDAYDRWDPVGRGIHESLVSSRQRVETQLSEFLASFCANLSGESTSTFPDISLAVSNMSHALRSKLLLVWNETENYAQAQMTFLCGVMQSLEANLRDYAEVAGPILEAWISHSKLYSEETLNWVLNYYQTGKAELLVFKEPLLAEYIEDEVISEAESKTSNVEESALVARLGGSGTLEKASDVAVIKYSKHSSEHAEDDQVELSIVHTEKSSIHFFGTNLPLRGTGENHRISADQKMEADPIPKIIYKSSPSESDFEADATSTSTDQVALRSSVLSSNHPSIPKKCFTRRCRRAREKFLNDFDL